MSDIIDLSSSSAPRGVITAWYGNTSNIPTGWALCDGNNGTPDLRDRFILGAGGSYSVGSTGGEVNHTLIIDEIPDHYHPFVVGNYRGDGSYMANSELAIPTHVTNTHSSGGGKPHNNMPPYYALCIIMKL